MYHVVGNQKEVREEGTTIVNLVVKKMRDTVNRREFLQLAAVAPVLAQSFSSIERSSAGDVAEAGHDLLTELMVPFLNEKNARRARHIREQGEDRYKKRVDPELNADRVNFLFSISGYNYEPPAMKIPVILESHTLISYHQTTKKLDSVSLTHETRAPEIERYVQRDDDGRSGPIKISESRKIGGFRLARRVFEHATGLAVDFQFSMTEDAVVAFVDEVLGGLKANVPQSFDVLESFYQDRRYPGRHFEAGEQMMDGLGTIQFIKAVPSENGNYDKRLEHNARKFIVFEGLGQSLREHALDVGFWLDLNTFLKESFNKNGKTGIACDFNPAELILNGMPSLIGSLAWARIRGKRIVFHPQTDKSVYVVDGRSGDGGVTWVTSDANPLTKRDLAEGRYNDRHMEVPLGGDPYADDLIESYWRSVRTLVKKKLDA